MPGRVFRTVRARFRSRRASRASVCCESRTGTPPLVPRITSKPGRLTSLHWSRTRTHVLAGLSGGKRETARAEVRATGHRSAAPERQQLQRPARRQLLLREPCGTEWRAKMSATATRAACIETCSYLGAVLRCDRSAHLQRAELGACAEPRACKILLALVSKRKSGTSLAGSRNGPKASTSSPPAIGLTKSAGFVPKGLSA